MQWGTSGQEKDDKLNLSRRASGLRDLFGVRTN